MNEIIEQKIKQDDGSFTSRKYEKNQFLGKGGFARCYKGVDIESSETVAIKVVEKSTLSKNRARQKLISQIKIHKSLNHPYIVKFLNVFEDQKCVYIILELCPHGTLSQMLKKRKKFTSAETRFYMKQLLESLEYLHKNQVIHRDLKMGNIFLAKNMEMKLGDFGLSAKLEFCEERKRTMAGTPNYIAPEILDGGSGHSYEVDLWSTGVICYALITGRPPFQTNELKLTYSKIKNCQYSFPSHVIVPEEGKNFIRNVLVLDPKKRMSITEMLDHPFLKSFIPKQIPISSLNEIPIFKSDSIKLKSPIKKQILTQSGESKKQNILNTNHSSNTTNTKNIEEIKIPRKVLSSPELDQAIIVCSYVDYSTKYGLAYSLSNGCNGVYFNDSTLLGVDHSHINYFYVQNPSNQSEITFYTTKDLPTQRNFAKKNMLLQRFEVHLQEETQNKEKMVDKSEGKKDRSLIYIKQWLKTKHAIMFRLSNSIFQVNFFDKSQILLSTDKKVILFTSKEGQKVVESLTNALHEKDSQMSRRIKYTREILNSLKKSN